MEKTQEQVFFEQKIAENVLRTANYEKLAETAEKNGKLYESRWWAERVKELKKEHETLMVRLASAGRPAEKKESLLNIEEVYDYMKLDHADYNDSREECAYFDGWMECLDALRELAKGKEFAG